jgi:hypothetical protein
VIDHIFKAAKRATAILTDAEIEGLVRDAGGAPAPSRR